MSVFFKGSRESVLLTVKANVMRDGGGTNSLPFKARYRCLSVDEREPFRLRMLPENEEDKISVIDELTRHVIVGWEGVLDSNDEPIEFNQENLDAAMNFPPYREALIDGALRATFGRVYEQAKNSRRPAATG